MFFEIGKVITVSMQIITIITQVTKTNRTKKFLRIYAFDYVDFTSAIFLIQADRKENV